MAENEKNYVDHTENQGEDFPKGEQRSFYLDISDVEQHLTVERAEEPTSPIQKQKKKGLVGLISFTFIVTAACGVSIYLLTTDYQKGFLLGNGQDQNIVNELNDPQTLEFQEPALQGEDANSVRNFEPVNEPTPDLTLPTSPRLPSQPSRQVIEIPDATFQVPSPIVSPPNRATQPPSNN